MIIVLIYDIWFGGEQVITPEKLNAIWTLLEAFGNARTHMNVNATRFTHIFSLDFDQSGAIASASIQVTNHGLCNYVFFNVLTKQ